MSTAMYWWIGFQAITFIGIPFNNANAALFFFGLISGLAALSLGII